MKIDNGNIPRTALIACSRLVDFAGAEITVLEVAEALRELGVEVEVAALEVGTPFSQEIDSLGIKYTNLSVENFDGRSFDLLWVNHYVTAYQLLFHHRVDFKSAVYSSLSYFEPLETPPVSGVGFSHYLVNSDENLAHFTKNFDGLADKVSVFPNACPRRFLEHYRSYNDIEVRSIAVISNHPPPEILELIEILRLNNVKADLIGNNGISTRVTPQLLDRYSAIITIGKTVQYGLATGTPVFCYDHFGGPGWITLGSFDAARARNFSGRCSQSHRPAYQIYEELVSGFPLARDQRDQLRSLAFTYFNLTENVLKVLDIIQSTQFSIQVSTTDQNVLLADVRLFLNLRNVVANYHAALAQTNSQISEFSRKLKEQADSHQSQIDLLRNAVSEGQKEIFDLNTILSSKELLLTEIRNELNSILNSRSWRVTRPVRHFAQICRLHLNRSRMVIRQEGIGTFINKSFTFVFRYWRRRLAMQKLERFTLHPASTSTSTVPLVSFVIPIYDRTDVLRTTIRSALDQTAQVFEVILVTDGSPASTIAVVDEFRTDPRVRVFSYPVSSGNAVRGRNKGILEARGRYVAFLDSDDIAAPDRLEVCLPLLEANDVDVVYGAWRALLDGTREIDGLINGQVVHSPDCDLSLLLKLCVPCQSTVIVRREVLQRAGYLKPRMEYREDHELWARLAHHGARFKAIPHVLTDLRLHAGNNELNFKTNDSHWQSLIDEEYRRLGPKPQKIVFLLASLGISGGAAVVFKHVSMLMEAGHDAFVVNLSGHGDIEWYGDPTIRVYNVDEPAAWQYSIDLLYATFWTTVEWLEKIPARRKLYLVQSDERLFYEADTIKEQVAQTYRSEYEFVAIAEWIVDMLRCEFGHADVNYVPNGLDHELFYPDTPLTPKDPNRIRILIEGPISVPFKGMADAYAAVGELDCELWIVSSHGRPDTNWRYSRFFEGVSREAMRGIYASCDILLKMSKVESFAYPPLEAMACGCLVVLGNVKGGIEYAQDGENLLLVKRGDITGARDAVTKLMNDEVLRNKLRAGGFSTAQQWSWDRSRAAMLKVVG